MSTSLTYHGAASYEIVSPTHTILIDPFLTGNPIAPCGPDDLRTPDVILVSHAAVDHYGDAPSVAKRTGAPVICDAAVRAKLIDDGVSPDQVTQTTWGIVVEVGGIVVRPVECHHWSIATLSDGSTVVGNPIAFVVETEPGIRNATATNMFKQAKVDTGIMVQVPPFINKGERIKVSTNDGSYMERA